MRRRLYFISLALSLILMPTVPGMADEVTAAMQRADARLQTRVTLRLPRVLVSELLERLSKQSGVPLIADDWSTAGSDSVAVSLNNVPVADAMNALWSLFSYKHMEWDWRRSPVKGEQGKYTYTLARPDYARFQAERLKEQVQADFEAQARELIGALDTPPDQLKEAARTDKLLNSLLVDSRVRPGLRILASLPPETLLNLLRNQQPLSLPITELSPDLQKALQESRAWEVALASKQGHPASSVGPQSDHVSIYVGSINGIVAPAIFIDVGRGSGDYFGGNYLEDAWLRKMNAEWVQSGEAVDNPAADCGLVYPKRPPAAPNQAHALADYLLRFADAAKAPLIARIPHDLDNGVSEGTISQLPASKTVKAFLAGVGKNSPNLQHKWRGGVLLLTCQNWFMDESEDARLPWAEVKRLRDVEAVGDGFLSLGDLAHAAAVLNVAQMGRLGEWFPVINNAVEWHDLLAFYDKTPEYRARVLSAKGDDSQYPESLVNAQLGIDALRLTHPNLRLQIQQKLRAEDKPPTHLIIFAVRDDDGTHALNGRGFGYTAREYQASLQMDEGASAVGSSTSPAK